MKKLQIIAGLSLIAGIALAAPQMPATKDLEIFKKNFARHHLGTTLLAFNASTRSYEPTEAAAAWLDDDIATGWPVLAGRQYYLIALSEPQLINNFCVSARGSNGSISLYAGDQPAVPGAESWAPLAKDLPIRNVNDTKMISPFSRFAKFVLLETDVAETNPIYSLFVYGNKSSVDYNLEKRDDRADAAGALGRFVNAPTGINLASLYTGGRATLGAGEDAVAWQRGIDDDPESIVALTPSEAPDQLSVRYGQTRAIQRVSALLDKPVRGKLEFFLKGTPKSGNREETAEEAMPVQPVATILFDGSSPRDSVDFPAKEASMLAVRWVPETPGESVGLRELNSFGDVSLNEYALRNPEAIGELTAGSGKDYKSGKEALPPIGEFLPDKSAFVPGPLAFPPDFPPNIQPPPPPPPQPPDNPLSP